MTWKLYKQAVLTHQNRVIRHVLTNAEQLFSDLNSLDFKLVLSDAVKRDYRNIMYVSKLTTELKLIAAKSNPAVETLF